jgi:flagellar hook-length control protein FliK
LPPIAVLPTTALHSTVAAPFGQTTFDRGAPDAGILSAPLDPSLSTGLIGDGSRGRKENSVEAVRTGFEGDAALSLLSRSVPDMPTALDVRDAPPERDPPATLATAAHATFAEETQPDGRPWGQVARDARGPERERLADVFRWESDTGRSVSEPIAADQDARRAAEMQSRSQSHVQVAREALTSEKERLAETFLGQPGWEHRVSHFMAADRNATAPAQIEIFAGLREQVARDALASERERVPEPIREGSAQASIGPESGATDSKQSGMGSGLGGQDDGLGAGAGPTRKATPPNTATERELFRVRVPLETSNEQSTRPRNGEGISPAMQAAVASGLTAHLLTYSTASIEGAPAGPTGAPDTKGSLPPGVPPGVPSDARLDTQIVQAMRLQWRDGAGRAVVTLEPEYLGAITVTLHVRNGAVTATLEADNPQVRAWMEANEPLLRQGLLEQGLSLDRLLVSGEERSDERRQPGDRRRPAPQEPSKTPSRRRDAPRFEVVV